MSEATKWIGAFSSEDRQEINLLREKQIYAIENGDANIYRNLCTDDVLLMLQGNDVVVGKPAFYECELQLLSKVKFESIQQFPIRIERQGDLAVEVGRQALSVAKSAQDSKDYKSHRKYTHIMRKTNEG